MHHLTTRQRPVRSCTDRTQALEQGTHAHAPRRRAASNRGARGQRAGGRRGVPSGRPPRGCSLACGGGTGDRPAPSRAPQTRPKATAPCLNASHGPRAPAPLACYVHSSPSDTALPCHPLLPPHRISTAHNLPATHSPSHCPTAAAACPAGMLRLPTPRFPRFGFNAARPPGIGPPQPPPGAQHPLCNPVPTCGLLASSRLAHASSRPERGCGCRCQPAARATKLRLGPHHPSTCTPPPNLFARAYQRAASLWIPVWLTVPKAGSASAVLASPRGAGRHGRAPPAPC